MKYFKHTMLPLLLSVTIYILFRSKVFMIITKTDFHSLYNLIKNFQLYCNPMKAFMPEWFLYSLPDGLWTYAFTSFFVIRLRNDAQSKVKTFALFFTPLLSIFFEIGQHFHITPGTFDYMDLAFDFGGSILPFILFYREPLYSTLPACIYREPLKKCL